MLDDARGLGVVQCEDLFGAPLAEIVVECYGRQEASVRRVGTASLGSCGLEGPAAQIESAAVADHFFDTITDDDGAKVAERNIRGVDGFAPISVGEALFGFV